MAYRDDLEALNAQVRTLKAELEAARQARNAARAAAKAAQAAADEAALSARRSSAPSTSGDGVRRWRTVSVVVCAVAVTVVGYLSYRLTSAGAEAETWRSDLVRKEKQLQLQRGQEEETRARLEERLMKVQRECLTKIASLRRSGHGQGGQPPGCLDPGTPPPRGDPPFSGDKGLPQTLGRAQIHAGMRAIKRRLQGCYARYKTPGLANVQVTIGRNGRVSSARTKGMFAGTPTGACVQVAARSARFDRFKGAPITITYPFILR